MISRAELLVFNKIFLIYIKFINKFVTVVKNIILFSLIIINVLGIYN